jgi:hypothetical protein
MQDDDGRRVGEMLGPERHDEVSDVLHHTADDDVILGEFGVLKRFEFNVCLLDLARWVVVVDFDYVFGNVLILRDLHRATLRCLVHVAIDCDSGSDLEWVVVKFLDLANIGNLLDFALFELFVLLVYMLSAEDSLSFVPVWGDDVAEIRILDVDTLSV